MTPGISRIFSAIALGLAVTAAGAQDSGDASLEVIPVRDNIYMISGAGGNTTVQLGDHGITVVDTKTEEAADELLRTIRGLAESPKRWFEVNPPSAHPALEGFEIGLRRSRWGTPEIRYVINTHHHRDHTGGNVVVGPAGRRFAGGNFAGDIADAAEGADIVAHENVLLRLSGARGEQAAVPEPAWPTSTFYGDLKEIFFNNEAIRIYYEPAAHTNGDVIVFFRRADVIAAGGIYNTELYPPIDVEAGGTVNGVIDALNHIVDLATPTYGPDGGTTIVPGHGYLSSIGDLIYYRDMVTIVRDRIRHMKSQGMSLDEVQAAEPTMDFDPVFGASEGAWTTSMFVEAVYETLD